jgi:hypothetical protein
MSVSHCWNCLAVDDIHHSLYPCYPKQQYFSLKALFEDSFAYQNLKFLDAVSWAQ